MAVPVYQSVMLPLLRFAAKKGGEQLTSLMIEHDVGVSTVSLYPVKKVDSDYFEESI